MCVAYSSLRYYLVSKKTISLGYQFGRVEVSGFKRGSLSTLYPFGDGHTGGGLKLMVDRPRSPLLMLTKFIPVGGSLAAATATSFSGQ